MTKPSLFRRIALLAALVAFAASAPLAVSARSGDDLARENTEINKMFHKLGRGVSNVLLGWLEIPKTISQEWRKTEPFTGTIVGAIKGTGWAVARTLTGVYEIVTFPFPLPHGYDPIMYPEFITPTVWGERLPIYQDEFLGGTGRERPVLHTSDLRATEGVDLPRPAQRRMY